MTINTNTLVSELLEKQQDAVAALDKGTTEVVELDGTTGNVISETKYTVPTHSRLSESKLLYPRDHRGRVTVKPEDFDPKMTISAMESVGYNTESILREAGGELSTANFPDLLRLGITFDAMTNYNETPVTYPQWCRTVDSAKQQEEYLKDAALGLAPVVPEGQPYPEASQDLNDGVKIANYKYGYILRFTEEMMRFDQLGKVRELAELAGRAIRLTEEQAAMNVLTTTGNYTRNSTTNDNDVGANTLTSGLSALTLVTVYTTLTTMKDRKTGVKLGVNPNVLFVSPRNKFAAIQLLQGQINQRVGSAAATADVYGTSTVNPFYGMITTVISSPYFGSAYEWALMEAPRAVTFQRVEGLQILREAQDGSSKTYFETDVIRLRARTYFGVGMRDDRFCFFLNSSTAPIVG